VHFWLSDSLRKVGRHDEALGPLGLGVTQAERQGQHYYDAERQRLRAEILLDTDGNAVEEAEALFGHALEIARRQEAKTFELRATTGPARRWNHTTNEVADLRRGSRVGRGSPCLRASVVRFFRHIKVSSVAAGVMASTIHNIWAFLQEPCS
jgi:hypothetical protein